MAPRIEESRMPSLRTWIVLSALSLASPAAADPPESDAKRLYEAGTKAYDLGNYDKAIADYKAAYEAKNEPAFLYNLGQCYRLKNDVAQALFFYRAYLRRQPNAPNRAEVEKRIQMFEEEQHRAPPNNPVPPRGETTVVAPKSHEPAVTPKSEEPVATPVAAEVARPVDETPSAPTPVYKKWWLWTVVVVALVGIGVGVGLGLTLGSGNSAPDSYFGVTRVF
jgi:tetratricopeptide (TPR) repeat protein